MDIAIDFDGTCVTHEYPYIGKDIGAIPVLKKITDKGHRLILFTMRSGKKLDEAVNWFKTNNIPLYSVGYNPGQGNWTSSTKCYAQLYIDDAGFGCPLLFNDQLSERPFVNWKAIEDYFDMPLLTKNF